MDTINIFKVAHQKKKFGLQDTVILYVSLVARTVKNLPAIQETWVQSLGQEDPLEKGTGYPLQYSGLENSID